MTAALKLLLVSLFVLVAQGCATTFIPVSWGLGDKVRQLSRSDHTLMTLFDRYDPKRETLRVSGQSFDQVMLPSQVKNHLGAYRPDTRQIYRNLYHDYNDLELRDLLVHELAHHIWFSFMNQQQQHEWRAHLADNPSPLQFMVRSSYPRPGDWDSEDFAFTVEYARPCDILQLARLNLITADECNIILRELPAVRHGIAPPHNHPAPAAPTQLSRAGLQVTDTGTERTK